MALHSKERYEPKKVERLFEHLRLYHEKGQAIDYEIIVDGFKVVRRTSDPNMFSVYESFVDADSKSMEVLLYSGNSNNNDKRIFFFGDLPKSESQGESLHGIELKDQIKAEVRKEARYEELEKQNEELEREINHLEKEVERLEKEKAILEAKQSPLNSFLGDVGSSLVESFLRRNPKLLSSIPGGEALAGLLERDGEVNGRVKDNDASSEAQDSEVTFQSKNAQPSDLHSQEDQAAIAFVNQLKAQFSKDEFDNVLLILQALAEDKTTIDLILHHINFKTDSHEKVSL